MDAPAALLEPTLDHERCYRAVASRDARFDGWFIVGVTSTGIYCRPSCPAPVRPKRANTTFFPTAAAAQGAGFRACKRCLPDASPGSPAWDLRADLAGRAMRAIGDGLVDREGVPGLARRLAVSERHLNRVLTRQLGAGPLALARANRAQTARTLIETTDLPFSDVAFAAGFSSIRQFNATVREVFATSPTDLRARRRRPSATRPGAITLRLSHREPLDWDGLHGWFGARAIAGVEDHRDGVLRRSLRLPHGAGVVDLRPVDGHIQATLVLDDVADLAVAVARCRRLLDLDADPQTILDVLVADPSLASLVRARPGLRVPGAADMTEALVRAIVGQQVSVAAARTVLGHIVATVDARVAPGDHDWTGRVTHVFPSAAQVSELAERDFPMPRQRAATLRRACDALASGHLDLEPGRARREAHADLMALPGIGPWTAGYVLLRGMGDPDVLLVTDLGVRRGARAVGIDATTLAHHGLRWRPWRSYASHHLWATAGSPPRAGTAAERPSSPSPSPTKATS